jgi:hypothetical protein
MNGLSFGVRKSAFGIYDTVFTQSSFRMHTGSEREARCARRHSQQIPRRSHFSFVQAHLALFEATLQSM